MKKTAKILVVLITLMLLVGVFAVFASASDAPFTVTYEGTLDADKYPQKDGELLDASGNKTGRAPIAGGSSEANTFYDAWRKHIWSTDAPYGERTVTLNDDYTQTAGEGADKWTSGSIGWGRPMSMIVDLNGKTLTFDGTPYTSETNKTSYAPLIQMSYSYGYDESEYPDAIRTTLMFKNGTINLKDLKNSFIQFQNGAKMDLIFENVTIVVDASCSVNDFGIIQSGSWQPANMDDVNIIFNNSTVDASAITTSGAQLSIVKLVYGNHVDLKLENSTFKVGAGRGILDGRSGDINSTYRNSTVEIINSTIDASNNGTPGDALFSASAGSGEAATKEEAAPPVFKFTNAVIKGKVRVGRACYEIYGGYYDCTFYGVQQMNDYSWTKIVNPGTNADGANTLGDYLSFPLTDNAPTSVEIFSSSNLRFTSDSAKFDEGEMYLTGRGWTWFPDGTEVFPRVDMDGTFDYTFEGGNADELDYDNINGKDEEVENAITSSVIDRYNDKYYQHVFNVDMSDTKYVDNGDKYNPGWRRENFSYFNSGGNGTIKDYHKWDTENIRFTTIEIDLKAPNREAAANADLRLSLSRNEKDADYLYTASYGFILVTREELANILDDGKWHNFTFIVDQGDYSNGTNNVEATFKVLCYVDGDLAFIKTAADFLASDNWGMKWYIAGSYHENKKPGSVQSFLINYSGEGYSQAAGTGLAKDNVKMTSYSTASALFENLKESHKDYGVTTTVGALLNRLNWNIFGDKNAVAGVYYEEGGVQKFRSYATFENALLAAAPGSTIELLRGVPGLAVVDKDVTVNTNGFEFNPVPVGLVAIKNGDVVEFSSSTDKMTVRFVDADGNTLVEYNTVKGSLLGADDIASLVNNVYNKSTGEIMLDVEWESNSNDGNTAVYKLVSARKIVTDAKYVVTEDLTGAYVTHGYTDIEFTLDMTNVRDKTTITLFADANMMTTAMWAGGLIEYNLPGLEFTIDLNGKRFGFGEGVASGDMLRVFSDATLNIKSSNSGASIHNYNVDNKNSGKLIFVSENIKYTLNYDGTNIEYYGGSLTSGGAEINVNGGYFNVFNMSDHAVFILVNGATLNVDGAEFYTNTEGNVRPFVEIKQNNAVNISNSTIVNKNAESTTDGWVANFVHVENGIANDAYNYNRQLITIEDSNISGFNAINTANGANFSGTSYKISGNCLFDIEPQDCANVEKVDSYTASAKADTLDEKATVDCTYNYATGSNVTKVYLTYNGLVTDTYVLAVRGDTAIAGGSVAEINNGVHTVTGASYAETMVSGGVDTQTTIEVNTPDTANVTLDVKYKYNLTLENELAINFVIPADLVGDNGITSIQLNGEDYKLKTQTIDGVKHKKVVIDNINIVNASTVYTLTVYSGEKSQEIKLSAVGYGKALLEQSMANNNQVEKELARSILEYAEGASNYFDKTVDTTIAEALAAADLPAREQLSTFEDGVKVETEGLGAAGIAGFYIDLNNSTPILVLTLAENFEGDYVQTRPGDELVVTVEYTNSSDKLRSKTYTLYNSDDASTAKAYIDTMKACDLDNPITVKIGKESWTLTLAHYLNWFATKGDSQKAFANALWNYVKAADAYKVFMNKTVKYSDFGADTTGATDSYEAIKAAHNHANLYNLAVEADEGAVYYIGVPSNLTDPSVDDLEKEIQVKTSTDWKDARFIIDDRNVTRDNYAYAVFRIAPTEEAKDLDLSSLNLDLSKFNPESKNIGLTSADFGVSGQVLLNVEDETTQIYKRAGLSGSNNQHDLLLVDENGNLDATTPFMYSYDNVSSIKMYSAYDTAITLKGGVFINIANKMPSAEWHGVYRGFIIERSNVTFSGVQHYMAGEPVKVSGASANADNTSSPYEAFYIIYGANKVKFENCVVTGHTFYQCLTNSSHNGTYDIQAQRSNDVSWINCTQGTINRVGVDHVDGKTHSEIIADLASAKPTIEAFNDTTFAGYDSTKFDVVDVTTLINNKDLWGVFASNGSKNLYIEGCNFSRFDAHRGLYNVTIKNSTIGYMATQLVGAGTATFENVTMYASEFIHIRNDYGSTWNGDINITNCTLYYTGDKNSDVVIIRAPWRNHDFGYECYLPNVTVNGLVCKYKSDGSNVSEDKIYLFGNFVAEYYKEYKFTDIFNKDNPKNINPYVLPEKWTTEKFNFADWVLNSADYPEWNEYLAKITKTRK